MDKIQKLLSKLTKKERTLIRKIFGDILILNLSSYDVKSLKGYKGVFRLRKGDVRIIFVKEGKIGMIIDIDYRKDIYKK